MSNKRKSREVKKAGGGKASPMALSRRRL
ncbi:hypothetical protein CL3_21130 [butyrate-producing bacterium SM4/1]|nr:hypothetical protein CLS_15940 [[Clostridium] cf. saccharolyticum K10]CBL36442.1 hypothetical protein CL3_21130 [butyrate-producing bacterium SM4/1]